MTETADPEHPTCGRCLRFAFGPRAGRLFMRCTPCAVQAMHLRNAQKETSR
jgi:hypothetical protein